MRNPLEGSQCIKKWMGWENLETCKGLGLFREYGSSGCSLSFSRDRTTGWVQHRALRLLTWAGAFICPALLPRGLVARQGHSHSASPLSFLNLKPCPSLANSFRFTRAFLKVVGVYILKIFPKCFSESPGTHLLRNQTGDSQVAGGCSEGFLSPTSLLPQQRGTFGVCSYGFPSQWCGAWMGAITEWNLVGAVEGWGEPWALAQREDSTCILSRVDVSMAFLRSAL